MANIKKIKLSDGSVYSIFDEGALRLNEQGQLVTGSAKIDSLIINNDLYVIEIDDVPVEESITNVLVQQVSTGRIMKRATDQLLEDIGGYSCDVQDGVFVAKLGK